MCAERRMMLLPDWPVSITDLARTSGIDQVYPHEQYNDQKGHEYRLLFFVYLDQVRDVSRVYESSHTSQ